MEKIFHSNIMLIARSWSNRGKNTDFRHLFKFFPGSINITNDHRINFDNSIYRKLKQRPNSDRYNSLSAALEWKAFRKSLFHKTKVIHFWFADHDYYYAQYFAPILGAKLVGNFFFSIEEFERRMPNKKHLEKLDLITASGKQQLEYLSHYYPRERIIFLPLGIDTDFYKPPSPNKCIRKKKPILLHVGTNRRDFKTLKKIFSLVKIQIPDAQLQLVSGDGAKELFNDIENVIFYPFVSDAELLEIYQNSSVLILPLLEGGSSQTLNEAMATGLPVITNWLPNLEDYISDKATILCAKGDAESMAQECCNLLKDSNYWDDLSIKSIHHSKQFDFKNIKNQIIEMYREYLNYNIIRDFK